MFKQAKRKLLGGGKTPRPLAELQGLYNQLCYKLGQAQYTANVHLKEVESLQREIETVNREAGERNKLDAEAAAKKVPAKAEEGKAL